ncbi:GMC oxidoreductase [Prochlorococcus sp. MIT 1341]|uniref:GMC oxidoreductase n=1 Tax=Prochlorococcus sp. MIT 1341 TaxID=3096221 RepID=UPI002A74A992|nr:GMC oxidoreductase [Prochlorococcus sp. MIT 1341]
MTNKKRIAVVGSGLASFGACSALSEDEKILVDIYDIGLTKKELFCTNKAVPNSKLYKGSYFAYGLNDNRWSRKIHSKRICSSHAWLGFSNVYSGSMLLPKSDDLSEWPEGSQPKQIDVDHIIDCLELIRGEDDLDYFFNISSKNEINTNDERKKDEADLILGHSRIAITRNVKKSGKEMITPFKPEGYLKELIRSSSFNYIPNCNVLSIKGTKSGNKIIFEKYNTELNQISHEESRVYDGVLLCAGCINTTGIVDLSIRSLNNNIDKTTYYSLYSAPIYLQAYLNLSINKSSKHSKIRGSELCSHFLEMRSQSTGNTWCHTQLGPINSEITRQIKSKLPKIIYPIYIWATSFIKFSITCYHSNIGIPSLIVCNTKRTNERYIQEMTIRENKNRSPKKAFYELFKSVLIKFNELFLIPIPFTSLLSQLLRGNQLGGWHFGGTTPMKERPVELSDCYPSGEVFGLPGVYVADSAGFPSIPGSTIALLIMTNGRRVARDCLKKIHGSSEKDF